MQYNALAAKAIIRSPITSCSTRDHSVAAAFAENRIGQKVVAGVHIAGEVYSTIALYFWFRAAD